MLERTRLLVPLAFLMALATLVFFNGSSGFAAPGSSWQKNDTSQEQNLVNLFVELSDKAISSGESFSIDLVVTNNGISPSTPLVQVILPSSVVVDFETLPSGLSLNVQNNSLDWLSTVPGNGGNAQTRLILTGLVADIQAPEQVISAILTDDVSEQIVTTSIWIGFPVSANISFNPPKAAVGQPVRFTGVVEGPGPITELWSLGDGRIVEALDPEVVYAAPGIYEIVLQAANPLGPVTTTGTIEVVPQPIAKFAVSDSAPVIGQPVIFTYSGGGLDPMTFSWDFGDGSISSEKEPSHAYPVPGDYLVHLVISNELGSSEAFLPITVGQAPISDVAITEIIEAGKVVEGQAFYDESVIAVKWDMGDGRSYEGEFVSHVYWHSGDFLVTAHIINDFGETTIQRWVQVLPGPLQLYLPLIYSGGATSAEVSKSQDSRTAAPTEEEAPSIPLEELELPDGMNEAEKLLAYINEARRLNGLASLTYSYELSVAAQSHTNDMAINGFTGHEGSDGSSPPWRVGTAGYPGGYAGEATAWGMQRAIEPVQYWLSSPLHRDILLNPRAGEVGVGYSLSYSAPNIWYWTAEFGSPGLPPVRIEKTVEADNDAALPPAAPELRLLGPPHNSEFAINAENILIFTWLWTGQLENDQRFGLYFRADGRTVRLGSVDAGDPGGQYQFSIPTTSVPVSPGTHEWQVRLEEGDSSTAVVESPFWPIRLLDALSVTPTPVSSAEDSR
jgi:uncharacterized protein YkwD